MDVGGFLIRMGVCGLLIVLAIATIAFIVWFGVAIYWVWHVLIKR